MSGFAAVQAKFSSVLTIVFDRVSEAPTGPVISTPTVGVAVRLFQDVVRDERSAISQHPGDYDLMQIGYLDGITLIACDPVVLVNASDLIEAGRRPDGVQLSLQEV